jgi:starch-binding outer membrane protein, SusD/RagB family
MNKQIITFLIAMLLSVAILPGCKKTFLEVPPQGQLTEEQALVDPEAANKLVGGVYNSLYAQGTVGIRMVILGNIASDDADKGSTPDDNGFDSKDIDNFTFTPNNSNFNDVWKAHYIGITRANKALQILESSTFDETTRKRLIGETRFLRGFFYFNLVRLFGGVPKLVRVPEPSEANNDEFQTRATKADIYAIVNDDLQYAVDNLPMKGEAGTQTGRANKGMAQSMLAKAYLYQENWQKAYDLSLAVMNSQKYNLAGDYATMFREAGANNIESIFEVETGPSKGPTGTCDAISPNFSNFQGPRAKGSWSNNVNGVQYDGDLGFGLNTPSADLVNAYEPNDIRKNGTIISIDPTNPTTLWDGFVIPAQPSVENQRYNYKAYHSPFKETQACNGIGDKDNKPKNIRIMRFAEVLLINAEAAAHIGQDALTPLARVRTRANLITTTATIADIWKERRVELGMENDRFLDLVRQGRAGVVLRANGKSFEDGKHELYPIPQAQIDHLFFMTNKHYSFIKGLSVFLFAAFVMLGCTKVEKDDNFEEGAPPPVPGGYVNSSEVATSNLLAYWNFDANYNEIKSNTAASFDSNASRIAGIKGQALHLNKGFVLYPTINSLSSANAIASCTVSLWIKIANNGNQASEFFALSQGPAAQTDWLTILNVAAETGRPASSQNITFHSWIGTYPAGARIGGDNINDYGNVGVDYQTVAGANKWTHYVMRWDAATENLDLYANSIRVSNNNFRHRTGLGPIVSPTPTRVLLGGFPTEITHFPLSGNQSWQALLDGSMDELRVYNKSLSDQEISALYQLERQGR